MTVYTYRHRVLHVEDVPIPTIADQVGTPFFCYASAALIEQYRALNVALSDLDVSILYAVKANSNLAVIRTLALEGAGADVVSEGELRQALAAGVPPDKIVFAGVGKTRQEMAMALDAGILQFNVESEPELDALEEVARSRGQLARIALRINPDVDAGTHAKITTGRKENKFGIDIDQAPAVYAHAAQLDHIDCCGLAVHIGSQITDLSPFRYAYDRTADLVRRLRSQGYAVRHLDLGGGLGIVYDREAQPDPVDYAEIVRTTVGDLGCRLFVEPGRFIAGDAGIFVVRVIYFKQGQVKAFAIVDGAMNDLIRPTLYDAFHAVQPVVAPQFPHDALLHPLDVVGPICESGDILARQQLLPPIIAGDLLALRTAGAYGFVMASSYNSRLLPPEILVQGDRFAVVRPRQTYETLLQACRLPDWLPA